MKVELLGHATVLVTASGGQRLLIDPYEEGGFQGKMRYQRVSEPVDYVLCTHEHLDHCATHTLQGGFVQLQLPSTEDERSDAFRLTTPCGVFEMLAWRLAHDEYGGRRFGGHVWAVRVCCDGVSMVHLSDVGHSPSVKDIEVLGKADVVLIPTGGFYTTGPLQAVEWVDRLGAKVCIPMHYQTPSCDLPLQPLEYFLSALRPFYEIIDQMDQNMDDSVICVDVCKTRVLPLVMSHQNSIKSNMIRDVVFRASGGVLQG